MSRLRRRWKNVADQQWEEQKAACGLNRSWWPWSTPTPKGGPEAFRPESSGEGLDAARLLGRSGLGGEPASRKEALDQLHRMADQVVAAGEAQRREAEQPPGAGLQGEGSRSSAPAGAQPPSPRSEKARIIKEEIMPFLQGLATGQLERGSGPAVKAAPSAGAAAGSSTTGAPQPRAAAEAPLLPPKGDPTAELLERLCRARAEAVSRASSSFDSCGASEAGSCASGAGPPHPGRSDPAGELLDRLLLAFPEGRLEDAGLAPGPAKELQPSLRRPGADDGAMADTEGEGEEPTAADSHEDASDDECEDEEADASTYTTLIHTLPLSKVAEVFETSLQGLDGPRCHEGPCGLNEIQASIYQNLWGANKITTPRCGPIQRFVQVAVGDFTVWPLYVCAVATARYMGLWPAVFFGLILVGVTSLELAVDEAVQSVMNELPDDAPRVQVVRTSASVDERLDLKLGPEELVPGDVIFLEPRDPVPADVLVIWGSEDFRVNESAIEEGSRSVAKCAGPVAESVDAMDAPNLAFSGTSVARGSATCVVHATGKNSFLGMAASGLRPWHVRADMEVQFFRLVRVVLLAWGCQRIYSSVAPYRQGR